jgi:hypothetical protein
MHLPLPLVMDLPPIKGGGRAVQSKCTWYRITPSLIGADPLQGPLEGVGPENRDFLGP